MEKSHIFCSAIKKTVVQDSYCQGKTCDQCPRLIKKTNSEKASTKKLKQNSKASTTSLPQKDLKKEYDDFIQKFKINPTPKNLFELIWDLQINPALITIIYCGDSFRDILIDLGNKGANISKIYQTIKPPPAIDESIKNKHPLIQKFLEPWIELNTSFNKNIENYEALSSKFRNKTKAIENAAKLITNLKPLLPVNEIDIPEELKGFDINKLNNDLAHIQKMLKEVIPAYCNLMVIYYDKKKNSYISGYVNNEWKIPLAKLCKQPRILIKPITSKSSVWNKRIAVLVDQIKAAGYSKNKTYSITAELLNSAYPDIFHSPLDCDTVRQRYSYHQKKLTK